MESTDDNKDFENIIYCDNCDNCSKLKEITLKALRISQNISIPKSMLENTSMEFVTNHITGCYVGYLNTWLAGEVKEETFEHTISYPATFWQMFKEQYFPEWLKEDFPVKYTTKTKQIHVEVKRYYPEIDVDLGKPIYKIYFRK